MIKIGKNIIFLFTFFYSAFLWASEAKVIATVDRNEMGLGDTFQLSISVQSQESFEVSEPRVPQLQGFDLVNASMSNSTSSKLVRGQHGMQFETVRQQDFIYMLSPKKTGSLQIPGFEVVVNGKVQVTKPIMVKVGAQGSGAGQLPPGRPAEDDLDEAEALFQQLLQRQRGMNPGAMGGMVQPPSGGGAPTPRRGHSQVVPRNPNEVFFVHLDLDKKEVYEGEQVTAEWSIYTRGNILSLDRVKFPDLRGFWKEIIEEVPALNFTSEVLNGVPYRRALLASHALFPIKPGTAIIDEYRVKANVQVPTGPLGQFGFGQAYSINRNSPRTEIKVKPLPTEGRPKDFTGAVGKFEVRASIEGNQFPVNQPFSYKVHFEGSGNAKLIELPPLELPAGIETFDTKSDSKFFKNGRSYKDFEVLIIPRQEGEIKIPSLHVSMFDPETGKYYSRATDPVTVRVSGAVDTGALADSRLGSAKSTTPPARVNVNTLPPLLIDSHASHGMLFHWRWWMVALLWVSTLAGLGYKVMQVLQFGRPKSNLRQLLRKKMKACDQISLEKDWRKFGSELANSCYMVLGGVSNQGGAHLEIKKLVDHLPTSVRRELEIEIRQLVDQIQTLCFAPEEMLGAMKSPEELKKLKAQTEKLLSRAIDLIEKD